MFKELSLIRNELIATNKENAYELFIDFFNSPNVDKKEEIIREFENENRKQTIDHLLKEIIKIHSKNRELYNEKFTFGQAIIWKEILSCYQVISQNTKLIRNSSIIYHSENYLKASDQIRKVISIYSNSQAKLSLLEDALGVDRYLDNISEFELSALNEQINGQNRYINKILKEYVYKFQLEWGNDNIPNIVYHKLHKYDEKNQICTMLPSNQKNVILFIIDGLGWSQFQWNKIACETSTGYAFKENIFKWLDENNCCRELLLGSPYISDTAAGLSQILTGKKANEGGVIASNLGLDGKLVTTKKMESQQFKQIFGGEFNCMTSVLASLGLECNVLYCTRFDNRHDGFSNYIFKDSIIKEIIPPERVYDVLLDQIKNDELAEVTLVYLTSIDNSGHTMGAYSKFEKYEHLKLNSLFRNFIIQLAQETPDIFNGETSILLTADHGMAETSKIMIYRDDLIQSLKCVDTGRINIIINNRSAFIYNIKEEQLESAKLALEQYFEEIDIDADVKIAKEATIRPFMPDNWHRANKLVPEMIIRLIGNGLFYTSKKLDERLLHYAGHGGASINEAIVPLIDITLNKKLLDDLNRRFVDIM